MRELDSIVLASVSPRRFELLTSLGLRVIVIPSDVDEGVRPGHGPLELAIFYAAAKAEAVARREPRAVIVAADTVVDLDGDALGKPREAAEAVAMLERLQGREHVVHTAFTLIDGEDGGRADRASSTRVRFRALDRSTIEAYVATGDPLDKAGSYGIQGRGAALVDRIEGDFYTVMGFPLGSFVRTLPELGLSLPGFSPADAR
jgi:septum formation protein